MFSQPCETKHRFFAESASDIITPHPSSLHLSIDAYPYFSKQLASPVRRKQFPSLVREFGDQLRPFGIPTLPVVHATEQCFHPRLKGWKMAVPTGEKSQKWRELYGGTLVEQSGAHEDENVFQKRDESALEGGFLANILKHQGIDTLVITGMKTSFCVYKTIRSAASYELKCHVIVDRLADPGVSDEFDNDPSWHKNQLHRSLLITSDLMSIGYVEFFYAKEYLQLLEEKPTLPAKTASVLTPEEKRFG